MRFNDEYDDLKNDLSCCQDFIRQKFNEQKAICIKEFGLPVSQHVNKLSRLLLNSVSEFMTKRFQELQVKKDELTKSIFLETLDSDISAMHVFYLNIFNDISACNMLPILYDELKILKEGFDKRLSEEFTREKNRIIFEHDIVLEQRSYNKKTLNVAKLAAWAAVIGVFISFISLFGDAFKRIFILNKLLELIKRWV